MDRQRSGSPALFSAAVLSALIGTPALAAVPEAQAFHLYLTTRGDTLIGLGRRFLVDPAAWPELASANGLRNPNRIATGTPLRIPLRLMRVEAASASVVSASGDVQSAGAGNVKAGQVLAQGAQLSTGADGNATVRLVDGTLLRLRASSRIGIEQSDRVRDAGLVRSGVRLEQGRVEVEVEPARGGNPGFRIGTPQGVLGVRGTEFRVALDDAQGDTRGEVLKGAVAAGGRAPGSPEQRVGAGFGVVVDRSGQALPPTPLLAPPDMSAVPTLQERPLVRVSLPALAGAAGYRALVAADPSFDRVLAELATAGPELRFADLPDGDYVLRVRGVDARGLEGRDADARFRLKARPEPPLPSAPSPRAVLFGSSVEFSWAANDEAQSYRLQLAAAGASGFGAPQREAADLRALKLSLDGLPPGRYQWRLASVRGAADRGPFGAAQEFELRPLPPTPPPPRVGEQSIQFAWEGAPGQTFDFQLARDAGFGTLVLERRLDSPGIELPLPGSGRFYMRIRARDADGFVGPFTAPQRFDVPNCVRDGSGLCLRADGQPLLLTHP